MLFQKASALLLFLSASIFLYSHDLLSQLAYPRPFRVPPDKTDSKSVYPGTGGGGVPQGSLSKMRFLKACSLDANKLPFLFGHSTFSESPSPIADTFVVVNERKECVLRTERRPNKMWILD